MTLSGKTKAEPAARAGVQSAFVVPEGHLRLVSAGTQACASRFGATGQGGAVRIEKLD